MLTSLWKDEVASGRQTALEALTQHVMIADADLNITYVNPSLQALLRDAEADLRKDLPKFSVANLVGSNIDVFHKQPAHQRALLAKLQTTHRALIHLGIWSFDLVVTPLKQGQKQLGFVVEWADAKARLQNVDYASKIAAIERSQAVIEFSIDTTVLRANENFLRLTGYTLSELCGKPHAMLVDHRASEDAEYQEFWRQLRAGQYRAGQYKRLRKDGSEFWVEATYNPVLDVNGNVVKIVEFANDVTAQVNLLANLKTLIDQNFGEIDGAIDRSKVEARAAAAAASDTSANVTAVAASAEQLAASIGEIARSMTRSRSATESAFEQAAAASKSTETLATASQAMSGIVALIRNVARQINLLALNATIEAARAGEAGRGFAVVASEVKELAIQVAGATEQISAEILGVQESSTQVVEALATIREAVSTLRESVTITASAVEEQSTVTSGMSENMQKAAGAVSAFRANIDEIDSAVGQAADAVTKTKEAAHVLVR